jgi:hypothetical protein
LIEVRAYKLELHVLNLEEHVWMNAVDYEMSVRTRRMVRRYGSGRNSLGLMGGSSCRLLFLLKFGRLNFALNELLLPIPLPPPLVPELSNVLAALLGMLPLIGGGETTVILLASAISPSLVSSTLPRRVGIDDMDDGEVPIPPSIPSELVEPASRRAEGEGDNEAVDGGGRVPLETGIGLEIEIELALGRSIESLDEVRLVDVDLDANFLIPNALG